MKKLVKTLTNWLTRQVELASAQGLIVGVSGGIDSAVIAYLIKRAFPENSLGVIMPINSNPIDIKHAEKVVKDCQIEHLTVDLSEMHEKMFTQISSQIKENHSWNENNARIADANLRARLRMSTLYTIGTNYNYLVVGTDNAAEWYTGYFTKYGDGGVDLQPIVDLTKHEVKELARYLGVTNDIIDKVPSADLWIGQTDEEEMGTSYKMIDKYLLGEEIPEKDQNIIENMHNRTQHKRQIATQLRLDRKIKR